MILLLVALCCIPQTLWTPVVLRCLRWGSVALLWLVWLAVQPLPLFARPHRPMLYFALALLPSVLLAELPSLAWSGVVHEQRVEWFGGYRDIVLIGLSWCVIAIHTMTARRLRWLMGCLLAAATLVVLIGYGEVLTHHNILYDHWGIRNPFYQRFIQQPRMMSTLIHPIILGTLMVLCIPLIIHALLTADRPALRILCGVLLGLCTGALILSFSRGSLIGLALALGSYLVAIRRRAWLWVVGVLILSIVLGFSLFVRSKYVRQGGARYSIAGLRTVPQQARWDRAAVAWEMVRRHPLWGIGLNHYRYTYDRYRPSGWAIYESKIPDNIYVHIVAETGVVGALAFGWLLWGGWRHWKRRVALTKDFSERSLLAAFGAGWIGLLGNFLTYDGLWWGLPLACFWIWLGILHAQPIAAASTAATASATQRATRRDGTRMRHRPWVRRLASRWAVVGELFQFLWQQRLWWMIPMIAVLLLFGALLLLAQSSPIAPFIYTLF